MRYRIGMWVIAGFLLDGFWGLFAVATFPSTPERMRDVRTVLCITCPVAILGTHYPLVSMSLLSRTPSRMLLSVSP